MSPTGASLKVEHRSGEIVEALAKLKAAAVDTYYVMDAIGQEVEERVRSCFEEGRSPEGLDWLPLKHREGQPLLDTGILRNSLTHRTATASVSVGTNSEYAATHQFGRDFGRGAPIPPRPFLPWDDLPAAWGESVLDLLRGHFLEKAGLSA